MPTPLPVDSKDETPCPRAQLRSSKRRRTDQTSLAGCEIGRRATVETLFLGKTDSLTDVA
jgi:hypothetical protein